MFRVAVQGADVSVCEALAVDQEVDVIDAVVIRGAAVTSQIAWFGLASGVALVMMTVGGLELATVTETGFEVVVFPALSVAIMVSVCEPREAVVVFQEYW